MKPQTRENLSLAILSLLVTGLLAALIYILMRDIPFKVAMRHRGHHLSVDTGAVSVEIPDSVPMTITHLSGTAHLMDDGKSSSRHAGSSPAPAIRSVSPPEDIVSPPSWLDARTIEEFRPRPPLPRPRPTGIYFK